MTAAVPPKRIVRSFVRREGRLTRGQRRALEQLWPRYGIPAGEEVLDLEAVFGRRAPVVLEIGFGNGEALLAMAAARPGTDYLGIEVHRPGIGRLLLGLEAQGLSNVRVLEGDAAELLARRLPGASLDAVHIFFPDPWPKKRHHKRRLVQPAFVELLRTRLKPGGRLHLATDWRDYAEHMAAVMERAPGFRNLSPHPPYIERPPDRPRTRFERRGADLGHGVWDLLYQRR